VDSEVDTIVSDVLTASIVTAIILTMEAVSTSKAQVYFYTSIWNSIPEGSHLHTHRRENLNSHILSPVPALKTERVISPKRPVFT
jgi:hypothetical protein